VTCLHHHHPLSADAFPRLRLPLGVVEPEPPLAWARGGVRGKGRREGSVRTPIPPLPPGRLLLLLLLLLLLHEERGSIAYSMKEGLEASWWWQ